MIISTRGTIVDDAAHAIWDALQPGYVLGPTTSEVPHSSKASRNCLDALDGKHTVQAPPNSRSVYYNFKSSYLVVLWPCSLNLQVLWLIDMGAYDGNSNEHFLQLPPWQSYSWEHPGYTRGCPCSKCWAVGSSARSAFQMRCFPSWEKAWGHIQNNKLFPRTGMQSTHRTGANNAIEEGVYHKLAEYFTVHLYSWRTDVDK